MTPSCGHMQAVDMMSGPHHSCYAGSATRRDMGEAATLAVGIRLRSTFLGRKAVITMIVDCTSAVGICLGPACSLAPCATHKNITSRQLSWYARTHCQDSCPGKQSTHHNMNSPYLGCGHMPKTSLQFGSLCSLPACTRPRPGLLLALSPSVAPCLPAYCSFTPLHVMLTPACVPIK